MKVELNTNGKNAGKPFQADIRMDFKKDISGQFVGHFKLSTAGKEYDGYITMDGIYLDIPESGGWFKRPLVQGASSAFVKLTTDPSSVAEIAEDPSIKRQSHNYWVISFKPSTKYMVELMEQSAGEEINKEGRELLETIIRNMNIYGEITITKENFLPQMLFLHIDAGKNKLLGDTSADSRSKFSSFNLSLSVELPPEAAAAKELPPGSSTFPGLPEIKIPGLL